MPMHLVHDADGCSRCFWPADMLTGLSADIGFARDERPDQATPGVAA